MSGRSHKPGFESSKLHLKQTVGTIIAPAPSIEATFVPAPSVGATLAPAPTVGANAAPAQETLSQKIARAIANARDKAISSPPRKVVSSVKSFKPLSNTSKKSILNSLERNRKHFIEDLESSRKILLNEAAYILTLYNRYPTMQLRIGDDTKINDIIKALQNRKEDENNTTEYDKLLEALQEIRKIHSIKEGGKRCKTRRKRRRTTRSSK